MITIPGGDYRVFKQLELQLPCDISFNTGDTCFITGDNGLGKTSFLKNILIPEIQKAIPEKNLLLFYVEQDFTLQFYAIRAYAAAAGGMQVGFRRFGEAISYMADIFSRFATEKEYTVFLVFDEIEIYERFSDVLERLKNMNKIVVMITHSPRTLRSVPGCRIIRFSQVSKTLTRVETTEDIWPDF